jgi:hypothetical protein
MGNLGKFFGKLLLFGDFPEFLSKFMNFRIFVLTFCCRLFILYSGVFVDGSFFGCQVSVVECRWLIVRVAVGMVVVGSWLWGVGCRVWAVDCQGWLSLTFPLSMPSSVHTVQYIHFGGWVNKTLVSQNYCEKAKK